MHNLKSTPWNWYLHKQTREKLNHTSIPSSSHSSRGFWGLSRHRGSIQDVVFVLWLRIDAEHRQWGIVLRDAFRTTSCGLFSASQQAGKHILKISQCLILPVLISEKPPEAISKLKIRNIKPLQPKLFIVQPLSIHKRI